ncbi:MAG: hypothetical protein MOIL_00635 [Candidatus Methanolliviera sp. GoM_oil]|nr:MAG: hypothetical protein MOIL_00635 [Candidatus Methanolliviera sp. GoM_oil]
MADEMNFYHRERFYDLPITIEEIILIYIRIRDDWSYLIALFIDPKYTDSTPVHSAQIGDGQYFDIGSGMIRNRSIRNRSIRNRSIRNRAGSDPFHTHIPYILQFFLCPLDLVFCNHALLDQRSNLLVIDRKNIFP